MAATANAPPKPLTLQLSLGTSKKNENSYHYGNYLYSCLKLYDLRVIAKRTLRDFWIKHGDSEQQSTAWYRETEKSEFKNLNELKIEYPSASILRDNRIVFNIKGYRCRLIVKFNFEYQICWIRFVGTHAEYDKINANEI